LAPAAGCQGRLTPLRDAWYKIPTFTELMADRACFRLVAGSFLAVLASGASAPCAADPYYLSPIDVEQAAVLHQPSANEEPLRLAPTADLFVQRAGDETGSIHELTEPPAAPESPAIEADAWAEAFAESARLGAVPPPPPYPVVVNAQVQRFIDHYTGARRDVVEAWLSRSQRYVGMIRDVLRAQGLPEDLAFVAMIESGFNPLAVSRAGAKGLWQFMAGTARQYGLRVDQWVDERFDPEKSTAAAAAYLRDLYRQFGSWALAKAAYNAGEVRIIAAIRALGTTDFWALARSRFLRDETKEFVPAIHAATVIGRDPGRFGFEPTPPPTPVTDTIKVPASTSLRSLSVSAGLPAEALLELNPVLVRGVTPPGSPYDLRIPAGSRDRILAALEAPKPTIVARKARPPARVVATEVHVVRRNETVSEIAQRYGVSTADLIRWNGLDRDARIRVGDRLRVAEARVHGRTAAAR